MGWMNKGPGYTPGDYANWAGFIAGAIAGYTVLGPVLHLELHPLLRLVVVIACGVAGGFAAEVLYQRTKRRGPDDRNGPPAP
jgi:hypothetical protein